MYSSNTLCTIERRRGQVTNMVSRLYLVYRDSTLGSKEQTLLTLMKCQKGNNKQYIQSKEKKEKKAPMVIVHFHSDTLRERKVSSLCSKVYTCFMAHRQMSLKLQKL